MGQYLHMDKPEQVKLTQFLVMMMLKTQDFFQDHWNFYFNKYNKNKEIQIYNLKLNVHF
jgi:hypothetical protein